MVLVRKGEERNEHDQFPTSCLIPNKGETDKIAQFLAMTIKWATFTFWAILNPMFHTHHRYFRKKVVIDRFLESKSFAFNVAVGLVFGAVTFYGITNLSPYVFQQEHGRKPSMSITLEKVDELWIKLTGEKSCDLPNVALEKARYIILSKVYVARDRMSAKRQREEVERLSEGVAELKAQKNSAQISE